MKSNNKQKESDDEDYDVFQDEQPKQDKKKAKKQEYELIDGQYSIDLTAKKRITVSKYKGSKLVSIREYFEKDGEFLPTKKGISLTVENWEKLKTLINTVDECITKI
ncbi:hypothetical protein pb186bvf_012540 [Paramecium bursaria]